MQFIVMQFRPLGLEDSVMFVKIEGECSLASFTSREAGLPGHVFARVCCNFVLSQKYNLTKNSTS